MKSSKSGRLAVVSILAFASFGAVATSAGARGRSPAATAGTCVVGLRSVDETGNLDMVMCDEAVSWIWANSSSPYEEKKPVTDHVANVQVMGNPFTLVRSFDAGGNVVGEDEVRIPHSRNGTVYMVGSAGSAGNMARFHEAAPVGWSGTAQDPSAVTIADAQKLVDDYNASLSPAGDWRIGTLEDNDVLLNGGDPTGALKLNSGDHAATYWSSDSPEGTSRFVRPVRSFSLAADGSLVTETPVEDVSVEKADEADSGSNLLVRGAMAAFVLVLVAGGISVRKRRNA